MLPVRNYYSAFPCQIRIVFDSYFEYSIRFPARLHMFRYCFVLIKKKDSPNFIQSGGTRCNVSDSRQLWYDSINMRASSGQSFVRKQMRSNNKQRILFSLSSPGVVFVLAALSWGPCHRPGILALTLELLGHTKCHDGWPVLWLLRRTWIFDLSEDGKVSDLGPKSFPGLSFHSKQA